MAENTTVDIPNPNTPLAFLPPLVANQFEISIYVMVAGLSAFVWDWVLSIQDEYKVLCKSNAHVIHVVYFLSRLSTLIFCTASVVLQSRDVVHCQLVLYVISSSFTVGLSCTSLLFYFRVRAIWHNSKTVTIFFGVLWLATLGTSLLVVTAIASDHIGTTQRCINTAVKPFVSAPVVINAINDTLIFIAISTRIIMHSRAGDTWRAKFKSFVRGDRLPRISKGLLQGGQSYFFVTIGTSIICAVTALSPGVPPFYRAMVSIPNLAIENAMACRVFRAVKLGYIKEVVGSVHVSASVARAARSDGNDIALGDTAFKPTRPVQVNVDITKVHARDDEFAYCKPREASQQV